MNIIQTNPYPELAKALASLGRPAGLTGSAGLTRSTITGGIPDEAFNATAGASTAPADSTASLSETTTAVAQVVQLIDQQISQIFSTSITASFPGATDMVKALADMKSAAAGWQPVKALMANAGLDAINAGPQAAALGQDMTDAAQIAAALKEFADNTLQAISAGYSQAGSALQQFQSALASVESSASSANDQAKSALNAVQVQIQSEIAGIKAQIDNLQSAGSIIIGILTGGISVAVQAKQLYDAIASLNSDAASAQLEQQAYGMAYAQFTNALSATDLGVRATATLNTSLEQTQNALNDIQLNTSTNIVVMQAELSSFRKEFAAVVVASRDLESQVPR